MVWIMNAPVSCRSDFLGGKMIGTILTYLSLAYSFDIAYEKTEWLLWDYDTSSIWYTHSNNYLGFRADVELRVGVDELYGFLGGQMYNGSRIEELKSGPSGFNPVFDDYQFRVGARAKHVELGWEYHCVHPITTYLIDDEALQWRKEGVYSKFYITVSGVIGGKK